ncbi:HAD hydrolase family protein [Mycoplasmopsis felifaucium]|uniref:HAD hydrolase family protein n=1 Tax=Mycoplasmopsis felifaucium TaxID=35768 RepID=UPI000488E4F9|nr:HAD hydrolase family protein [Mycoplasmopsis felifaucium]
MNSNKPTYFIDLDGTLFDRQYNSRMSKRNISAIMMLKNFANVIFSTGRSYHDARLKKTLHIFNLNDVICTSGAEIYIKNKLANCFEMKAELVKEIVSYCITNKINFVVFDHKSESVYVQSRFGKWFNKLLFRKKWRIIDYAKNFDINNHKTVLKIAFVLKNNMKSSKVLNKFKLLFEKRVNAYLASKNYIIEITDKSINKGIAESLYMKELNLDPGNSTHIGDSDADTGAKGYVNKLVAMKNASKSLKNVADEIAPKCRSAGLFKFFTTKKKVIND